MSVAVVIQLAKHIRHIILLSVAFPTITYVSTLFHKGHDSGEKNFFEHKMCALIFCALFV